MLCRHWDRISTGYCILFAGLTLWLVVMCILLMNIFLQMHFTLHSSYAIDFEQPAAFEYYLAPNYLL